MGEGWAKPQPAPEPANAAAPTDARTALWPRMKARAVAGGLPVFRSMMRAVAARDRARAAADPHEQDMGE